MNTKKQIEEGIKSLEWLKFNIFGTEEPKKNTFEYAAKVYLENAVELLKDSMVYAEIEKEIGIDLPTLFKALREPVYVIVNDKIVETYCGYIGEECKTISFDIDGKDYKNLYDIETFYALTKDYGKTWALTKEKLKNEK